MGKQAAACPTQLTNTDLEVTVWLRPVEPVEGDQQEPFSQWWAKQLALLPVSAETSEADQGPRLAYLAERYNL